jgi:MFS family permease
MEQAAGPADVAEGTLRAANRVFWQFWTASTVSDWGSGVTVVALPVIALTRLHASAFEVSLLTAASYGAWLVIGLPAGALVQRYPLRATQVTMDVSRAVAIASIPVAYAFGVLGVAQLVGVALIVSFAGVMFAVGNATFLPRIIPRSDLTRRNSIVSATDSVTKFGGPAFAGVLIALAGPVLSLTVDAISYVLSSAVLSRLPDPGLQPPKSRRPIVHDITEGIAFVWRHPVMRPCVLAATVLNFGCGALAALLPVFVIRGAGASAAVVGPVLATEGVGSFLAALLAGRLVKRAGSARTAVIGLAIAALGAILFPLAQGRAALVVFGAGNLVWGAGVVIFSIVTRTHRQVDTPPEVLSRVMATVRFVSWGSIPIGAVVGGLLGTWFAMTVALSLVTVAMLVSLLIAVLSPVRGRTSLEGV